MIVFLLFCVLSANGLDLYEGEICVKIDQIGTCTSIRRCPTAIADIRNRKTPQLCSFNGSDPIVCCITNSSTPNITTPVKEIVDFDKEASPCGPLPPILTAPKTGQISWDKCIDYQEKLVYPCTEVDYPTRKNMCNHNAKELIVGETQVVQYEFPHMALLGIDGSINNYELISGCEGAVISERFILTSAHCSNYNGRKVTHVFIGSSISNNTYGVQRIIQHPDYKPPNRHNDIALIKTDRPLQIEIFVPACLPIGDIKDTRTYHTGWGIIGSDKRILQKVTVIKRPSSECTENTQLIRDGLDGTQICVQDPTNSTCQGNGGILQIENKRIHCMYTIVGVASYATKNCGESGPGVYTSVAAYVPWIESVVWA